MQLLAQIVHDKFNYFNCKVEKLQFFKMAARVHTALLRIERVCAI